MCKIEFWATGEKLMFNTSTSSNLQPFITYGKHTAQKRRINQCSASFPSVYQHWELGEGGDHSSIGRVCGRSLWSHFHKFINLYFLKLYFILVCWCEELGEERRGVCAQHCSFPSTPSRKSSTAAMFQNIYLTCVGELGRAGEQERNNNWRIVLQ